MQNKSFSLESIRTQNPLATALSIAASFLISAVGLVPLVHATLQTDLHDGYLSYSKLAKAIGKFERLYNTSKAKNEKKDFMSLVIPSDFSKEASYTLARIFLTQKRFDFVFTSILDQQNKGLELLVYSAARGEKALLNILYCLDKSAGGNTPSNFDFSEIDYNFGKLDTKRIEGLNLIKFFSKNRSRMYGVYYSIYLNPKTPQEVKAQALDLLGGLPETNQSSEVNEELLSQNPERIEGSDGSTKEAEIALGSFTLEDDKKWPVG